MLEKGYNGLKEGAMELTQKVIKLMKDADKLVEIVKKGVGQIAADAKSVKDTFEKDGEKKE